MLPRTKRTLAIVVTVLLIAFALVWNFVLKSPRYGKLPVGPRPVEVALGDDHGIIVAPNGSLWTWGDARFGWHSLGLGTNVLNQPSLRQIGHETNWATVAAGNSATLAIKTDGSMWAWGENLDGQLGSTMMPEQTVPVPSAPGTDWKQVACGGPHSLALKRDGSLWSWGNNWAGQLGDGTANSSRTPVRVGTSTNWSRIWANLIQNVAQQKDGTLWFWGWDYTKSKNGSSIPVPTRISPDTNWVDVGMGDWMVFAIKSDGTLWAWGKDAHCFTIAPNPTANSSPVQVGHDTDWLKCSYFGSSRPLFMKRDGSLWVLNNGDHRGFAVVTKLVQALVANNQLRCIANSQTLGGDSEFGVKKALQISYEINGKPSVTNFAEDLPVFLDGYGQTLKITRALYGDPRRLSEADGLSPKELDYQPSRLQRITLNKQIVAFCGGRHGLGVAITADGEVWQWGEILGQTKPAVFPLPILGKVLNRFHVKTPWLETTPMVLKEPARLAVSSE